MTDAESDSDERLDRVLRELGAVEAPEGMEERVLAQVRTKQAAGGSRMTFWGVRWARQMGTAGALLVLVAGGFVWEGQRAPREAAVGARVQQPMAALAASASPAAVVPVRAAPPSPTRRHRLGKVASRGTDSGETPSALISGLLNRPAPEEPLTAEERMLLRIARRGRREEYVALDPGVQEARMSAEKSDFGKFFEPTTVVTGERN